MPWVRTGSLSTQLRRHALKIGIAIWCYNDAELCFTQQWEGFMNLPAGAELIIILIIVVLVFGVGRISKLGKELGSGIRAFREGLKGDEESDSESTDGNVATSIEDASER